MFNTLNGQKLLILIDKNIKDTYVMSTMIKYINDQRYSDQYTTNEDNEY